MVLPGRGVPNTFSVRVCACVRACVRACGGGGGGGGTEYLLSVEDNIPGDKMYVVFITILTFRLSYLAD